MVVNIHRHYESVLQENLEHFIRFEDRGQWELRHRLQFPVYQSTDSELEYNGMEIKQTIKIQSALVRQDDADQIKIDQPSRHWGQELRREGWRDPFRGFPARKPIVTTHEQLPPRVTSEFINHSCQRAMQHCHARLSPILAIRQRSIRTSMSLCLNRTRCISSLIQFRWQRVFRMGFGIRI